MVKPLEVLVGVSLGLFLDDLVSRIPCVNRQKVRIELEHVLGCLITEVHDCLHILNSLLELGPALSAKDGCAIVVVLISGLFGSCFAGLGCNSLT